MVAAHKPASTSPGAVQRKLGKVTQTANAGFNIRSFNFVTTVVLTQNTTFEQGTGTEIFTWVGDRASLYDPVAKRWREEPLAVSAEDR